MPSSCLSTWDYKLCPLSILPLPHSPISQNPVVSQPGFPLIVVHVMTDNRLKVEKKENEI